MRSKSGRGKCKANCNKLDFKARIRLQEHKDQQSHKQTLKSVRLCNKIPEMLSQELQEEELRRDNKETQIIRQTIKSLYSSRIKYQRCDKN